MARTGDRVQWPLTLEQLVLDDLEGISELLEQTIARTVSGILGRAWGMVFDATFDTSEFTGAADPATVYIGKTMFLTSFKPATSGGVTDTTEAEGRAIWYDPARAEQTQTGVVITPGVTNWLLFRPNYVSSDVSNRFHWSAGAPIVASAATRVREVVEFLAVGSTDSETLHTGGWAAFARVKWSGNIPTIETLGLLDGPTYQYHEDVHMGRPTPPVDGLDGIAGYLRSVVAQVTMLLDSGWQFDASGVTLIQGDPVSFGLEQPSRGIKQINDALDSMLAESNSSSAGGTTWSATVDAAGASNTLYRDLDVTVTTSLTGGDTYTITIYTRGTNAIPHAVLDAADVAVAILPVEGSSPLVPSSVSVSALTGTNTAVDVGPAGTTELYHDQVQITFKLYDVSGASYVTGSSHVIVSANVKTV